MPAAVSRRLPGLRFEALPPPRRDVLPRMDVAVFVGFAAGGPIHIPVAIEDPEQYAAVFGGDLLLAWDAAAGATTRAQLAPAVRAFFANGGSRCWVIRVAGDGARANRFPLPGVLLARRGDDGSLTVSPAALAARSRGSGSDPLQLATGIEAIGVELLALADTVDGIAAELGWDGGTALPIGVGSLLRISWQTPRRDCLLAVATANPDAPPPSGGRRRVRVGGRPVWVVPVDDAGPDGRLVDIHADGDARLAAGALSGPTTDGAWSLEFAPADGLTPAPGRLLRVDGGGESLWFCVADGNGPASASGSVRLIGSLLRIDADAGALGLPPATADGADAAVLALDLAVRDGGDLLARRDGLTPTGADPGSLWFAPDDDRRFAADDLADPAAPIDPTTLAFPLAGLAGIVPGDDWLLLPVAVDSLFGPWLPALPDPASRLERDGLADFSADLFLDPELAEEGTSTLLAAADYLRYTGPSPRRLQGLHAALGFGQARIADDASLILVPDAIHTGWQAEAVPVAPLPPVTAPKAAPAAEGFDACSRRRPPQPTVVGPATVDAGEPLPLAWPGAPADRYELETAAAPDFVGGFVCYAGADPAVELPALAAGRHWFRVRGWLGGEAGDWSLPVAVDVDARSIWVATAAADYADADLHRVHAALLKLCAAHGGFTACLGLPAHYREEALLGHGARLRADPDLSTGAPMDVLSYGALYHPWVLQRSGDGGVAALPPDGVVAGMVARRARDRGAWIAAANEPLRDVIALARPIAADRRLDLLAAQANEVRQEARGFLVLNADTLAADPDLRPLNVRRLLILLRRLCLQVGQRFVFEPNDGVLRRTLKRTFDDLLNDLFRRGAFAGSRPEQGFQVVADGALNPPAAVDAGRCLVEIRVAPVLPMRFLTVRLVRNGDRLSVEEGS